MAEQDRAKDLVGKAASKMTVVAGQAMAAAARRQRIDAERRVLADLRGQALQLRARIGEEMFKLWQTHTLPPSSLDYLFEAVDRTMAEIAAQNERIERMSVAQPAQTSDQGEMTDEEVIEAALPPPPLPAARTHILTEGEQPCPSCGTANPPGHRFCGDCGTPLGSERCLTP
ncbi:MAG: zinc ribbon domain-containing protein [Chloroflexota bacterium]